MYGNLVSKDYIVFSFQMGIIIAKLSYLEPSANQQKDSKLKHQWDVKKK